MDENPGLSEQYRRSSPWPLFVAVGLAIAEIGVFLGIVPLAVAGLLLLGGSCAGILRESGYVATPFRPLRAIGLLFLGLGGTLWALRVTNVTVAAMLTAIETDGVALRGAAVVLAGALLMIGGYAGRAWAGSNVSP